MRKFALSLAALALVASPALAGKYNKKLNIGDKAPTFAGIPATTPKGEEASLSLTDLKEDVVVLVFLANHCPAVVAYEDRLQQLVDDYKGKSVKVVGVACSGSRETKVDNLDAIKDRLKEGSDKKFNYVYGFDDTQKVGKDYGAVATPTFFVLDKDRKVRYMGALDDNGKEQDVKKTYVKDAVNALLAGKDVEVTETQAKGCGISYDK